MASFIISKEAETNYVSASLKIMQNLNYHFHTIFKEPFNVSFNMGFA